MPKEKLCSMGIFIEDVNHLLTPYILLYLLDIMAIVTCFTVNFLILLFHYHFNHQILKAYFVRFYYLNYMLAGLNRQVVIVCYSYLSENKNL